MSLMPSQLKKQSLFVNGFFTTAAKTVKLPPIKFKREDFRAGVMTGNAKWRSGIDDGPLEFTLGGLEKTVIKAMGSTALDGTQIRFAGAFQADDTGEIQAVEVIVQGQVNEFDPGDGEVGKGTEHKFVVDWVYYKLSIDGADVVEIDHLRGIVKFDGVDIEADLRAAAGQ